MVNEFNKKEFDKSLHSTLFFEEKRNISSRQKTTMTTTTTATENGNNRERKNAQDIHPKKVSAMGLDAAPAPALQKEKEMMHKKTKRRIKQHNYNKGTKYILGF